ncbi:MAG: 50S ribosomal protein L19 [Oligoflexales bacterium]
MKNKLITDFEEQVFAKTKQHPDFRPGDTVRVHYKVEEGTKTKDGEKKFRIQAFEGVCIRFRKGTIDSTFTVRRVGANGVGVERVIPLCSPHIERIDLIAGGSVRRSRLFFLRERSGKSARIKTRRLPAGTQMTTQAVES